MAAMFKATHEKYLQESTWESATTGRIDFVETWKYADVCSIADFPRSSCELIKLT